MIADLVNVDTVAILPTRYGRMMCLTNDLYIGQAYRWYGEYSESEVELFRRLIQPGMIVVDAGANIGALTVPLAQFVPKGAVIAFEPLRFLHHLLCGNVALNGLANVVPYYAAAGAARGTITVPGIDYTQEQNYGGLELGNWQVGNLVPVLPLDDLVPRIDFLKADVEGMELAVLQGAAKLIARWRPILYVENNPDSQHDGISPKQQALITYIQELGYDVWWHLAPHYNPNNHNRLADNHYGDIVSVNMLALPAHPDNKVDGLEPIPRVA